MAIVSFRHRGLQQLWEDDNARGVGQLAPRLQLMLPALNRAKEIQDLSKFPGWRLHRLTHDLAGRWSLSVNRHWRLDFLFEDGQVLDLNLTAHYN